MKWYTGLYTGDSITCDIEDIKLKIAGKCKVKNLFLITLPANNKNILDIISVKMGMLITWREVFVIGVAGSRREAVEMVSRILTSIYNETGGFNLKEYFKEYD